MRVWVLVVLGVFFAGCAEQRAGESGTQTRSGADEPQTAQESGVSAERHDAIERMFARKATELQTCWTDEYEKSHNRKLEGDVTLGMTITPGGQANDVKVLTTTI